MGRRRGARLSQLLITPTAHASAETPRAATFRNSLHAKQHLPEPRAL